MPSSYLSSYERGTRGSSSSSSLATSSASAKKVSAERNQQVLRTLLNDPGNKFCGDCKTSGHPRWASWSIGIFLCIRCSGIHRSMGTHISKVRSVDLDSWSDEQIENMVKWGNKRANLYWEAKLPPNYTPDDSKIANFIRTKYDLKRWVKAGGIPDPSTLGEQEPSQEESTPLSEVKNRLSEGKPVVPLKSRSAGTASKASTSSNLIPDLLGGGPPTSTSSIGLQKTVVNSTGNNTKSTSGITVNSTAPPAVPAKNDLLGGLDFGSSNGSNPAPPPPPPARSDSLFGLDFANPPSTSTTSSKPPQRSQQSRPDLKKSILSLYAPTSTSQSAPRPNPVNTFDSLASQTNNLSLGNSLDFSNTSNSKVLQSGSGFNSGLHTTSGNNLSSGLGTISVSSGLSHNSTNSTQQQNSSSTLFDNLISGTTSAWASTPTEHTVHSRKKSEDEWASFTSAPATTKSTANGGNEDDLFKNVWN